MVAIMGASSEIWQNQEATVVSASDKELCADANAIRAKTRWDTKTLLQQVKRLMNAALFVGISGATTSSCTNQPLTAPVTDAKGRSEPTTMPQLVVASSAPATVSDAVVPAAVFDSIAEKTDPTDKPIVVASADDTVLPPELLAAISTNDSTPSSTPEVRDGEVVPPERLSDFFAKLGYDEKALGGVKDTVEKMKAAKRALGDKVVLGAMISESQIDKPKILKKAPDNNPQETFALVTGFPELTMDNHETVFAKILSDGVDAEIDAEQVASYQTMVTNLGPEMTKEWFKTFNVVVKKMPAQNKYLLQQAFLTTSSVYAYANENLRANLDASLVADQVWRLILLVTNKDDNVVVARLMYGNTIDTAFSRRIPNHQVLKAVFDKVGIVLPESLYDIAGPGAQAMGINTTEFVDGIRKNAQLDQKIGRNRQASAQMDEMGMLTSPIDDIFDRVDKNLLAFIKNPTIGLQTSISNDMIQVRAIKAKMETLSPEKKKDELYKVTMTLIGKMEIMVAGSGIKV